MTKFQQGFTLVEAVMVIAITGIIAAVVAVFIRAPVQGYFDSARRAELTDVADTAVRRISRDLRLALPNSVRVQLVAGVYYLEFLQTSDGGRYRAEGPGDILDFSVADNAFDVLGPPATMVAGAQNLLAVYNLGIPGADAYQGDNTAAIANVLGNKVTLTGTKQFPFASPDNRFQIISYPVSYVCNPTAGTLTRYFNYTIAAAQPTAFIVGPTLIANNVTNCSFSYSALVVTQRTGLVLTWLQLGQSTGETVSLHHEVHVSNVP